MHRIRKDFGCHGLENFPNILGLFAIVLNILQDSQCCLEWEPHFVVKRKKA